MRWCAAAMLSWRTLPPSPRWVQLPQRRGRPCGCSWHSSGEGLERHGVAQRRGDWVSQPGAAGKDPGVCGWDARWRPTVGSGACRGTARATARSSATLHATKGIGFHIPIAMAGHPRAVHAQDSCQAALRMGEQLGNKRQALNEAEARGAQTHAEARRVQADILAAAAAGDAAVHETLTVHKALQAQQDALDMVLTQLHAASQRADREDARTAALRTRLQAQGAWQSQWDAGIRSGAEAAESAEKWLRHLETIVLHGLARLQRLERHLAALRCLGGNHERGLEVERGKLSRASRDLDEALGQHRTAACQGLQERPWKLLSVQGVRSVGGSSAPAPDLERQAADLEARLTGAEVAGSRLTARLEDVSAKVKALEAYQGARSGQQCKAAREPRIDLDAQLRTAKSSLVQAQLKASQLAQDIDLLREALSAALSVQARPELPSASSCTPVPTRPTDEKVQVSPELKRPGNILDMTGLPHSGSEGSGAGLAVCMPTLRATLVPYGIRSRTRKS
uniref:Uncharacterized protein n=1 Tax=Auxenochlorella protothecoides TaxID=3075 RepID=A0A1D1ZST6_AUXPR